MTGMRRRSGAGAAMDEISQGSERDPRLSPERRRMLAAAAIAGLVAVAVPVALTRGGEHGRVAPRASVTTSSQQIAPPGPQNVSAASSPKVTPSNQPWVVGQDKTFTCQSATPRQLGPDWRAGSLHVGPLWLVAGRQLGYVHPDGWLLPAGTAAGHGSSVRTVQMLIRVDPESVVMMYLAPGTGPYFQFLDGAGQPLGGNSIVFEPCPDSHRADVYHLGFSIAAGHTASVLVWTMPSAQPSWITLSAPTGGLTRASHGRGGSAGRDDHAPG
jgi:hypothetical protein